MREMDFTEKNLRNRWLGVNNIWYQLRQETRGRVKRYLERAMTEEVSRHVGCRRYQRSRDRRGYRNGSYARSLLTEYGWIADLSVPRIREGSYQPGCLDRYRRRCRQVDRVLLEAFLLGCATRKTRRVCQAAFGADLSPQGVSNIVHGLDDEVKEFHRRPLSDRYRFLYLDGLWLSFRRPRKLKKVLLVALGIGFDGTCELVSFQLAGSESASCWWGFIGDMKQRGLTGGSLEVIVTDGATGLLKALEGHYPRVTRQRCVFHKVMDMKPYLTTKGRRNRIIADAFHIFEAATVTEAEKRLRLFADRWRKQELQAVRSLHRNFEDCLTYLAYVDPIRTRLKTNNPIERYIQEIERRTVPMRSFGNTKSADRIIYGIIAYVLNQKQDMTVTEFTQFT